MNFLTKPFDNLRIRQAFALSIQRDRLRYDIFKDTVVPTYHIIPEGMDEYSGSKLVGPFNVQDTNGNSSKAQQLFQEGLQQEGWSGVAQIPPNNSMNYGQNNSADANQEQLVQAQLEQADVETDLARRVLDYQNAEQRLVDQVAWLPLY